MLAERRSGPGRSIFRRKAGRAPAASEDRDRTLSTLAHLSHYSAGRYLSELLLLARGFLLAGFLEPALYGGWTKMKIVLLLLGYGQLGVHEAMLREAPFAAGRGDQRRVDAIVRDTLGFSLATSLIISAGILVAALLWPAGSMGRFRTAWSLLAAVFGLAQLYWYLHLKLRAEKRFAGVGRMMVVFVTASTLLGAAGAYAFGLSGLLVGLVVSYLVVFVTLEPGRSPFPRPSWDRARARELVRIGLPIMSAGGLVTLLWSVDKLAIWAFLTPESLGHYGLLSYLVLATALIPEAVSTVLYPRLMEELGRRSSTAPAEAYLVKPSLIIAMIAGPALGLLVLWMPIPVRWFLPEYTPGIVPGQILLAGAYFMAVARMPQTLLVSVGRQRLLLVLTALSVGVAVAAIGGALAAGWGLAGVALGSSLSFLFYSIAVTWASTRVLDISRKKAARLLTDLLVPFLVSGGVLTIVLAIGSRAATTFWADLLSSVLRSLPLLVIGLGVGWIWVRRKHVFARTAHDEKPGRDPSPVAPRE